MNNHSVTDWSRPEIQQLSAYHVPELGNAIKLDAMENPYQWDTALVEEWLNVLRTASLNRYPDAAAREVKQQLHDARLCKSLIQWTLFLGMAPTN